MQDESKGCGHVSREGENVYRGCLWEWFGAGLCLCLSVRCSGWRRMEESLRVVMSFRTETRGAGFLCRAERGAALLSGALLGVSISCVAAADVCSA